MVRKSVPDSSRWVASLVLEHYGFRPFKTAGRAALGADIARLVKAQIKPKVIFFRALEILVREKIEVPGYFPLASLILRAINQHNRALVATVRHLLTPETQALLDSMLQQQAIAAGDAPGKTSAYRLTALKKLSQSTKPATVKACVADLEQVEKSFRSLQPLLEGLALSPEALQYYAQSVIHAEIFQLTRRDEKNRYLHLAAFVAHQYCRLQDNLVAVLLATMQRLQNRARRQHQEYCYAEREQHHASLKTLFGYFDPGVLETLVIIRALTENTALADSEKVTRIRAVLAANETATSLDEGTLTELKASAMKDMGDEDYYEFLSAQSLRAQNRVGPILKAITFINEPNAADLKAALDHFKAQDGLIDKRAPVGFLSPKELAAVTVGGAFRVSLYKVLLFVHVQLGIKSGTVNLDHSYKYRPLDAYLIDRDRWQRDKARSLNGPACRPSSIPIRCSRNSMPRCTHNMSSQTPISGMATISTSNSRKTASASAPRSRRNGMRGPCRSTSPPVTSCRSWNYWPPSIGTPTGWANSSTGNSATTETRGRTAPSTPASLPWAAPLGFRKWRAFLTPSARPSSRTPSIGTSRSTT